jgi:hypothetical protein
MFQFVCIHITSFVTHTHSEVVANEVMAEDLQLVHVHLGPILFETVQLHQTTSRSLAFSIHTKLTYVNLYVFILTNIMLHLFHTVIVGH